MVELFTVLSGARKEKRGEWEGWTRIAGWGSDDNPNIEDIPDWVAQAIRVIEVRTAPRSSSYYEVNGEHYRYRVVPIGQGVSHMRVYRKLKKKEKDNGQSALGRPLPVGSRARKQTLPPALRRH